MLTVWLYGCCWCWQMQSSVLHSADTQILHYRFLLQPPWKNLSHLLAVSLMPLVRNSPQLWCSCHMALSASEASNSFPVLSCHLKQVVVPMESFLVQPALVAPLGSLLFVCVTNVSWYRITIVAVLNSFRVI